MVKEEQVIIAVDFDGTIVTHEYPRIGKDIGAIPVLKRLVDESHLLILYTMRDEDELDEAQAYIHSFGIHLYGVNVNPNQKKWTDSPKAFANLYIDDAALGIPLKNPMNGKQSYVDWEKVEDLLERTGVLTSKSRNRAQRHIDMLAERAQKQGKLFPDPLGTV